MTVSPALLCSQGAGLPEAFYADALHRLSRSTIPFLVGGAFALARYTQIERPTKDLDLYLRFQDVSEALSLFKGAGYHVELPYPHWLAKVHDRDHFIDLIFNSGNGVARVDDRWFARGVPHRVLGVTVRLCAPEEMIWSKAFVQERERFDGADVIHLLRGFAASLDWDRLLDQFGEYWRVLFSHLVLFGFVYPDKRDRVPAWVMSELARRLASERADPDNHICYGTLLSREQYAHDIAHLGYFDARVRPIGRMTPHEIEIWHAAIDEHR